MCDHPSSSSLTNRIRPCLSYSASSLSVPRCGPNTAGTRLSTAGSDDIRAKKVADVPTKVFSATSGSHSLTTLIMPIRIWGYQRSHQGLAYIGMNSLDTLQYSITFITIFNQTALRLQMIRYKRDGQRSKQMKQSMGNGGCRRVRERCIGIECLVYQRVHNLSLTSMISNILSRSESPVQNSPSCFSINDSNSLQITCAGLTALAVFASCGSESSSFGVKSGTASVRRLRWARGTSRIPLGSLLS
jgi:hypothetical protein